MNKYLYIYNYIPEYENLAKYELKILLSGLHHDYFILSNDNIDVTLSPFIKHKIELINVNCNFQELVDNINDVQTSDFLIKYIHTPKQLKITRKEEVEYCKQLGLKYLNEVNFDNPSTLFAITKIDGNYYYGKLETNNKEFKKRNNKPISYSNSLDIVIAKSCLNIVTKGDNTLSIVDPCCGVGTVVIEGLAQDYNIIGFDINFKVVNNANDNLRHFKLPEVCQTSDIKDLTSHYDCAIVDVPYGLFSLTTEAQTTDIIMNSKRIANDVIIISSVDLTNIFKTCKLEVEDVVTVSKKMNREFKRYLYIIRKTDE